MQSDIYSTARYNTNLFVAVSSTWSFVKHSAPFVKDEYGVELQFYPDHRQPANSLSDM